MLLLSKTKLNYLAIFKELKDKHALMEEGNVLLEELLTKVPGITINTLCQKAIALLPQKEPSRPVKEISSINIIVKMFNPEKFPVQSNYLRCILNYLHNAGQLHNVIGRNAKGQF